MVSTTFEIGLCFDMVKGPWNVLILETNFLFSAILEEVQLLRDMSFNFQAKFSLCNNAGK